MSMDVSAPFTTLEFKQQFRKAAEHTQVRWGDRLVYVAFEREGSGLEKPVVVQQGQQQGYAASPCHETLKATVTNTQRAEGCELVIKPLTLAELARNAGYHEVSIALCDADGSYYFTSEYENDLLGMTAAIQDLQGNEIIYFAKVFEFEDLASAPKIPRGSLQYWEPTSPQYREPTPIEYLSCVDTYQGTMHVFDDQLDWADPLFPKLPENAVAISTLSESAQVFFNKLKAPLLLARNPGRSDSPIEPGRPTSLVGTDLLENFLRLRTRLSEMLVPPTSEITLTISELDQPEELPDNMPASYEISLSFTAPCGIKAAFPSDWASISLLEANPELPSAPGTHLVTEVLRERIVDHLAWAFFQRARCFDLVGCESDLAGLFPGRISNGSTYFQPDYRDERFPCLARWSFGKHEVAVLLLGQDGRNFICKPMKYQGIPASDRPTLVPYLDAITHDDYQLMVLDPTCDRLSVPTSMIDFPEHWYLGARLSDTEVFSSLLTAVSEHATSITGSSTLAPDATKALAQEPKNQLKWMMVGCAAALLVAILFVGAR